VFTDHFKMTHLPFSEKAAADQLLQDERVSQGLARLEYFAKAGNVALITGYTGVGKSSLLKLFLRSLSRNLFHAIYLALTNVSAIGLLKLIVMALGEVPKRGKERLFVEILEKTRKTELTTLIVLDDAHLLPPEALTDLRLLVSSALEDGPGLKLILSGQERLADELRRASHADLVHRISVRYRMTPLTKDQTAAYVDFHMNKAGASQKIFEPEAKALIHDYASGFPRQINNIATACLIHAAGLNSQKITENVVNDTMTEFQLA
jgi:general secretion pathway protein A